LGLRNNTGSWGKEGERDFAIFEKKHSNEFKFNFELKQKNNATA
jgi:hypothetical protein